MKANEFVKKFGIDEAKRIVEYRDKHASRTHVYKFNKSCADKAKLSGGAYLYTESYGEWSVSVDELKRLIESHQIVNTKFKGLEDAKWWHECCWDCDSVAYTPTERLKQAIADVESCQ